MLGFYRKYKGSQSPTQCPSLLRPLLRQWITFNLLSGKAQILSMFATRTEVTEPLKKVFLTLTSKIRRTASEAPMGSNYEFGLKGHRL